MKAFVKFLLIATCLVACANARPGTTLSDPFDDDDFEDVNFDIVMPSFFSDTINRLRQHLLDYFWTMPDMTNFKIPEGANTTSTTKIINGHVVTINETTYTSGDDTSGSAFHIRIIDVKPQNDTIPAIGGDAEATTKPAEESRETVEEFNNEISKNVDTLTA